MSLRIQDIPSVLLFGYLSSTVFFLLVYLIIPAFRHKKKSFLNRSGILAIVFQVLWFINELCRYILLMSESREADGFLSPDQKMLTYFDNSVLWISIATSIVFGVLYHQIFWSEKNRQKIILVFFSIVFTYLLLNIEGVIIIMTSFMSDFVSSRWELESAAIVELQNWIPSIVIFAVCWIDFRQLGWKS